MPPATTESEVVLRFGGFELDTRSGELRRDNTPVKLPPQPLKILVALARHPGELQSREEIRSILWKNGTFVDYELGVNYCLNQIRKALGDDAHAPRFIETVPRRGYRFIALVETVPAPEDGVWSTAPSIAVLPFVNLCPDQNNALFCDGLTDEIITSLTRVHGLRVTARTSSFAFRDRQEDVRRIGAQLGVSTLLEGSVQRADERIRVSVQWVSVEDGFHIWSRHYDCSRQDMFLIEDEISGAVANALKLRLTRSRGSRPAANRAAHNSWLKARHYCSGDSCDALSKARRCLDEAIALDPLFSDAYVSLAELLLIHADLGMLEPRKAALEGRRAIQKSLELDDSSGELFALSGAYRGWIDFDWNGARADFDRALDLTPASALVHTLYASTYLVPIGRLTEAEREMELALELDPLSPMAHIELARVLIWNRKFDRARSRMEAALDLWPEHALVKWFMGVAFYFQGRLEDALRFWRPAIERIGSTPVMRGAIGMALGQLGMQREARMMLEEMEASARDSYVPCYCRAQIHIGLGETDRAMEMLERAVEERDPHLFDLPYKPTWDSLRPHPRFQALLRKMHLT